VLEATPNWEDPQKRRREAIRAASERDVKTLLNLLAYYLLYKSKKRSLTSLHTFRAYGQGVRDWVNWAWPEAAKGPRVPLLKATADDVDRWLAELLEKGGHLAEGKGPLKPASAALYLSAVRAFYRALIWAGAMGHNPAAEVRTPGDPTPRHERRPALPLALYQRLVEYLEENDAPEAAADLALVRLMGDAGLRISEALALDLADLDLEAGLVHVKKGKGGKARTVPLTHAARSALKRWLGLRPAYAAPGEQAVFVNTGGRRAKGHRLQAHTLRRRLSGYYRALDFPARYRGAHTLRHLAGTRLYRVTRDLHVTASLLGHANVTTSAIYAKMDLDQLKEAVQKLEESG